MSTALHAIAYAALAVLALVVVVVLLGRWD
jgi:hypothetical protein